MSHEKIVSSKEVIKILDNFIGYLRNLYHIDKFPNKVERVCQECCSQSMKLSDFKELGFEYIKLDEMGIKEPYHFASLLGFPTEEGAKWYLVDPTYGQFFESSRFKNYMFATAKEFSLELLDKGYIECNLLNMLSYINGFIFSRAFVDNVDVELVYHKLEERLLKQKIVSKDIQETIDRLIILLKAREELLGSVTTDTEEIILKS